MFQAFKEKKETLTIFFDLSKAFDKVSHVAVMYKLCHLGLRGRSLRWLHSFFKTGISRSLWGVNVHHIILSKQGYHRVPYYSKPSLICNIRLLHDTSHLQCILQLIVEDDITFAVTANTVLDAQTQLQRAVNSFLHWTHPWALEVNPSKTKLMCFTRKRIQMIPNIFIGREKVDFVTNHCFLGLYLDSPLLTWKRHIDYLRRPCMKRLDIMKRIASSNWGSSTVSLITFYKASIRSKLDYGCEVYSSASLSLLSTLNVIQSTALRLATGTFRTSLILAIHTESNILPLKYWRSLRVRLTTQR